MQLRSLALILALLAATLAGPTRAQEPSTLIINLTSDDISTQQMALQFARNYTTMTGGDLVIFLNVRAVGIANQNVPQHTSALAGKTPQQLISELLDGGARVFLCPGCTRQSGLSMDDRIDGVEPSGPDFHAILASPDSKVMSY